MELTVIVIMVVFAIFIFCRETVCWYWKRNEQIAIQKEIKGLLDEQNDLLLDLVNQSGRDIQPKTRREQQKDRTPAQGFIICSSCGKSHPKSVQTCPDCGHFIKA